MPRSTREWAKRKLSMSVNNIQWALAHLQEVYEVYNSSHPEIGITITLIQHGLAEVGMAIEELNKQI